MRNNRTDRSPKWNGVGRRTFHRLVVFIGNDPINQAFVVFRISMCVQTRFLPDKKGQISRMIRFLCFFAAARVTTGHAVFSVNRYLMDTCASVSRY